MKIFNKYKYKIWEHLTFRLYVVHKIRRLTEMCLLMPWIFSFNA